jgi:hypothetical protein
MSVYCVTSVYWGVAILVSGLIAWHDKVVRNIRCPEA